MLIPLLSFAESIMNSIPRWIAIFNKKKEGTPEERAEFRKRIAALRKSAAWQIEPNPIDPDPTD